MENAREFKQFDIVIVNEPYYDKSGSCQNGKRPYVICQNEVGCKYSPTLVVMPLTTNLKKLNQPTHEVLRRGTDNKLIKDSMILGEQVRTVDKQYVEKKIGYVGNVKDKTKVFKCFFANLYGDECYIQNDILCYA